MLEKKYYDGMQIHDVLCECLDDYDTILTILEKFASLPSAINADRKTENNSEKPNNCEVKNYCDDCLYIDTCDSKEFFYACTSKATISKMEQVDKDINVRSKDEPQTERIRKCIDCRFVSECRYTNPDSVICERFWQKERSE